MEESTDVRPEGESPLSLYSDGSARQRLLSLFARGAALLDRTACPPGKAFVHSYAKGVGDFPYTPPCPPEDGKLHVYTWEPPWPDLSPDDVGGCVPAPPRDELERTLTLSRSYNGDRCPEEPYMFRLPPAAAA